jgi:2-methylcitrate dehydratase PrpD
MDIMASLVSNITKTRFNNLTPASVEAAKKGILDTIGLILGGSSMRGCQLLIQALKEMGGKEESTIAVFGGKVPSNLAALANGAMGRALDLDDVHDAFVLHPDASIVPTALAIAERQKGVTGQELITAVALGQDLMVRMGLATKSNATVLGRLNPFKVFAATGTAGKLMELDDEKLLNAMGIAYSHLVGDAQAHLDGAMTQYIQEGEASKSAVEAAIFAAKGITGAKNILEGERGFFKGMEIQCDFEALVFELGSKFMGADIAIKPYCSCRSTHEAIDLALSMVKNRGIDTAKISQVTVRVNQKTYSLSCQPLDQKRRPKDQLDALFSLPFAVACALLKGDVFIDEMTDEMIHDPDVLRLAALVTPLKDDECETGSAVGATVLEIETMDGQRFSDRESLPLGNPQNPIDLDGCVAKFRKCARYAHKPFADHQLDNITSQLTLLEDLEDASQIARWLVP